MKVKLVVKRCKDSESDHYMEDYSVTCEDTISVSQLLEQINETSEHPIQWECSCRQSMCGACAMLINGIPKLACEAFVREYLDEKTQEAQIHLAPLSKFPVICDLKVDRSVIYENLEKARLWIEENAKMNKKEAEYEYMSATCLMCGCCYEVCPNYSTEGTFEGAGIMNASYRVINQTAAGKKKKELRREYRKNGMNGCSRSLSCEHVCPAGIPLSVTMSRLNGTFWI